MSGVEYRVKHRYSCVWGDLYYPQVKYRWWPFWLSITECSTMDFALFLCEEHNRYRENKNKNHRGGIV